MGTSKAAAALDVGMCLATFSNFKRLDGRNPLIGLPLDPNREWATFKLAIPTMLLSPICPGVTGGIEKAEIMFAINVDDYMPSFAWYVNNIVLTCLASENTLAGGTVGLSYIAAAASRYGLSYIASGFSLPSRFYKEVKLWNGKRVLDVAVNGNYFDQVQLALPTDELGPAAEWFELTGTQTRMIKFFDPAVFKSIRDSDDIFGALAAV